MKNQVSGALGALVGSVLLTAFGVVAASFGLCAVVAAALTVPSRTRPFGIGLWSAFLAAGIFFGMRHVLL